MVGASERILFVNHFVVFNQPRMHLYHICHLTSTQKLFLMFLLFLIFQKRLEHVFSTAFARKHESSVIPLKSFPPKLPTLKKWPEK